MTILLVLWELIVHPLEELLFELTVDRLGVHEVAEAASLTRALLILATLSFSKVSDGRVLGHDHASTVVASIHALHSGLSLGFVSELDIDVANHVITDVVSDDHLFHLAKLCHLHVDFLVEALKVLDSLDQVLLRHVPAISKGDCRVRVLVHVLKAHRLTQRWFVMDPCARITVPTCADFEIKRAVHSTDTNEGKGVNTDEDLYYDLSLTCLLLYRRYSVDALPFTNVLLSIKTIDIYILKLVEKSFFLS